LQQPCLGQDDDDDGNGTELNTAVVPRFHFGLTIESSNFQLFFFSQARHFPKNA
jgi:hypothetical protein